MTSLHVLLAVVAKIDIEKLQLDAVNAFVNAYLDITVFIRMPLGYDKQSKLLKQNTVVYALRRSSLLRREKLTDEMKKLPFK